jgi:hypothetical protein
MTFPPKYKDFFFKALSQVTHGKESLVFCRNGPHLVMHAAS